MDKKKRTLLRSAVLGITAIATSLTIGISAGCSTGSGSSSTDGDEDKTTTKIDEQTIKNGNFEFYSDNKGLYPISNPDSWSRGTSGNSSSSMSGVINTRKDRWDYITAPDFAKTLEDNDDLNSTDENKKDYNGALTDDLPYKNTHAATDSSKNETDEDKPKAFIDNPFTHNYSYDESGQVLKADGTVVTTFTDEDGNVFLDADFKEPLETSVLMIHNYRSGDYYGAETYFTSSTTVSLEANTAAEISLWVKTTEMYFGGSSDAEERASAKIEFDRGAYIKVNTSVGGNSLDAFEIKNINTEQLNTEGENNGWVQYTIYVAASSFATTSVNLVLGLGENEAGTVEGYAFFDDVTIKKYNSVADMTDTEKNPAFDSNIRFDKNDENPNVSYPLSPDAQNEFRVDVEKYQTEDKEGNDITTEKTYYNNSADRHFFIDFANSAFKSSNTIGLNSQNVTAGLTIEDTNTGKWVCTKYDSATNKYKTNLDATDYSDLYIPSGLRNNGIKLGEDILATTTVGSGDDWTFNAITTDYSEILTDALKTAPLLPGAGEDTKALVMLSAYGAAYEAHIQDGSFALAGDEYMLVSFWIKTSDMNGKTAATVTVKGLDDDKDIKSSFTVDTTTLSKVTIGEGDDKIEDAYNGWARCFIRVSNTTKDKDNKKPFEIVVNFGNTTISSSTRQSYKAGWLALANISVMELDEDVYGYTSGSSQTATIEFTETVEQASHQFDTEQGEKNEIKNNLATPASYTGVNGNSKYINSSTTVDIDGYHDTNKNDYAGLLSKENFENYATNGCMWYNALSLIEADNETPDKLWSAIFGERTVQPLLIVNTIREKKNGTVSLGEKRYNYGYIGKSASVGANAYKAVSVRVKASTGAVANVYLVEDKTGGEVLTYTTPKYNFWYDADGNILKGEPAENETVAQQKANIAYTLRPDGLYENGDGKLYANFYNLTKQYDLSFEHESFYNGDGEAVKFEDLVAGEDYYAYSNLTAYAPHYLVAGGKDNNKVYLYTGNKVDKMATYYYVEDGKANTNKVVYGIDTSVASLRYEHGVNSSTPYQFTIDTVKNPEYANKWITVTFYIHSGTESKGYKLELWSGARDVESSYDSGAYARDSYVVFDYSDLSSSLNQSTFDGLVKGYTDDIILEYKKNIDEIDDNDANIADLEKLADEKVNLYNYEAAYYTFSLYDSEAFIPFNGEINTEDTGYSFDYTDSAESLAYLKVVDNGLPYGTDATNNPDAIYTMSAFIDYSVIDKDVDIIGEPTAPGTSDNDSDSDSNSGNSANVWLLASSIALVAAMILAIIVLFVRDFAKKHKGRKSSSKNTYNFNKNKRYVKKYVKANGETPVIGEDKVDESLLSDKPDETTGVEPEAEAEATVEEPKAEPVAEEKVEEPAATETPAESTENTPSEETKPSAEVKPEDGKKDE